MIGLGAPDGAGAQTVRGTLLDVETGQPVPYGLVLMFEETGDSVTATTSDESGTFAISSPEPGSFVLLAGALGYEETPAGVFELGADGVVTVRYGLRPSPLPLDEVVVSLDRPARVHHLVRNGFVRRLQRGLGVFVTPHAIEESSARSTEQLLAGRPGIRVGPVYTRPTPSGAGGVQVGLPRPDIGEAILVNSAGGWCVPTVYVDGVPTHYEPDAGQTLSNLAGIGDIEALEVYRRPAEIPVEYDPGARSNCGVVVAWTKTGLAPGQRGDSALDDDPGSRLLPGVRRRGAPPDRGEWVRVQLTRDHARESGLGSPWEGWFVRAGEVDVVASDALTGRLYALPRSDVEAIQVRRPRDPGFAWVRAGAAGLAGAAGTWGGLTLLCSWSECNGSAYDRWLPAAVVGGLVAWAMYRQGPGEHWLETSLPAADFGGEGARLEWSVPAGGSRNR